MFQYLKRLNRIFGTGLMTGAAGDDPSGIGVYTQAGAQFGYSLLWTAPLSYPFLAVVQEICGRIGLVTGKGLAQTVKENYPKPLLYALVLILFISNTVNIGANLAVMAESLQLVWNISFYAAVVVFGLISLLLQVFIPYPNYSKILRYLTLSLIVYVGMPFVESIDWKLVASGLIPSLSSSKEFLMISLAILGVTISPYLFFWQANEEVEKAIEEKRQPHSNQTDSQNAELRTTNMRYMRFGTTAGMLFSNILMFFIMLAAASAFDGKSVMSVHSASTAAEALRPIGHKGTYIIFALAMLRSGLLSIPILAGAGTYAVSEALGWKSSLHFNVKQAPGFYVVLGVLMLIGAAVAFLPIQPFKLLYYSAILNGLSAFPLLVVIMLIASNKAIMKTNANSLFSNLLGWGITATIFSFSVIFVWKLIASL